MKDLLTDEEITKHELPDGDYDITGLLQAQIAKLLKHRSRPELREKIKDILCIKWAKAPPYDWEIDQLLLLYPDEEEIRKDERDKIGGELVQAGYFVTLKQYLDEIGGFRMLNALKKGE